MLTYLRDKLHTARLRARYERIVQERVLELAEAGGPQTVAEDPGRWTLLGGLKSPLDETARTDLRTKARRLVVDSPHARNLLRLMEIYTVGPGLRLNHAGVESRTEHAQRDSGSRPSTLDSRLLRTADRIWTEFLTANCRHFSYREFARRTWRDGECFLRLYAAAGGTEWYDSPSRTAAADPSRFRESHSEPRHGVSRP